MDNKKDEGSHQTSTDSGGYVASFSSDNLNVDLNSVPVKVKSVRFDGLSRTKTDYVVEATDSVFTSKNFGELILKIGEAQQNLKSLNAFSEVATLVDTTKTTSAISDYDVVFIVKELKRINGGVKTMVGANEGSLNVGVRAPNLLGRGEMVSFDHAISSRYEKKSEVTFSKPLPYSKIKIDTSVFSKSSPYPYSGYIEHAAGSATGFSYTFPNLDNLMVQWQGTWRQLTSCQKLHPGLLTSMNFGHSIKSALKLIFTSDKRDQLIFPTYGRLCKAVLELAGFGGDARFLKVENEIQHNYSTIGGIVLQGGLRWGATIPFYNSMLSCNISDHFFLGGPTSLRGFSMNGVGPRSNNCALGGKIYWSSGLHVFSPLPFMKPSTVITDVTRLHGFVNVGSIGNYILDDDFKHIRTTLGFGLAFKFAGLARLEVNYCFPVKYKKTDDIRQGLQVGMGVEFL